MPLIALLCLATALAATSRPQGTATGAVAFQQACLDATTDAIVLNVAAHPDDEAARTMVLLRHGLGARTVTVYSTCGGGGQNAIGREIGPRLAAIRIRETLAAASHTGTDVRWLGFPDFGYSKTREETVAFWGGEDELLRRMSDVVDAVAPDLVITNHGLARGHGHHRASAWAIREECKKRGIPLYERVFEKGPAPIELDVGSADSIRGSTFAKQAHDGWREHETQGPWSEHDPSKVRPDKWAPVNRYSKALGDPTAAVLPSMFDSAAVQGALARIEVDVAKLRDDLAAFGGDRTRAAHVAEARRLLPILRVVHERIKRDRAQPRIARRIDALERILAADGGVTVAAELVDEKVSRGQIADIRVTVRSPRPLDGSVECDEGLKVGLEEGRAVCSFEVPIDVMSDDWAGKITQSVSIPVHAEVLLDDVLVGLDTSVLVELGPRLSAAWPRDALFVPAGAAWERVVSLEIASAIGMKEPQPIVFRAPEGLAVEAMPSEVTLTAEQPRARVFVRLRSDGSLRRRFVLRARVGGAKPARIEVQPLSTAPVEGLRIGLVRGPDDTTARFLTDLGIDFTTLGETELATTDLSRFTTLVLDIRAYQHRPDLKNHRDRILAFNEAGGRVVAFYHKAREWNATKSKPSIAPFDLTVGRLRVSQEDAPVEVLAADHALLTSPFRIEPTDFDGWVQERGLNFPEKWDPEWTPLLRMHDKGEKALDGSLLVATHGSGSYVYCALALYRQLRVGHLGAARLVLNLLTP